MITIIPLGTTYFHGALLSHELMDTLERAPDDEHTLLLYNRRWSGRAWICEDCSHYPTCPHCDIALAYHRIPHPQGVCHHCGYRAPLVHECEFCHGHRFREVGIGIQKVEHDLKKILPDALTIMRIDSDQIKKTTQMIQGASLSHIILSTYAWLPLIHLPLVKRVVFLLFESDLTLPDYRMEEDLYHTLEYAKKSGKEVIIQTYMPDHPLLETITEGNYKSFLAYMTAERKKFSYPPYTEFVSIGIQDRSKEKLKDLQSKIVNKILQNKPETIQISYDTDIRDRSRSLWLTRILLRGKEISPLLRSLEVELVKNRSTFLEWR